MDTDIILKTMDLIKNKYWLDEYIALKYEKMVDVVVKSWIEVDRNSL